MLLFQIFLDTWRVLWKMLVRKGALTEYLYRRCLSWHCPPLLSGSGDIFRENNQACGSGSGFNDFVDPDSESGSMGKKMKKKCTS
jgi:hypothetical protein